MKARKNEAEKYAFFHTHKFQRRFPFNFNGDECDLINFLLSLEYPELKTLL